MIAAIDQGTFDYTLFRMSFTLWVETYRECSQENRPYDTMALIVDSRWWHFKSKCWTLVATHIEDKVGRCGHKKKKDYRQEDVIARIMLLPERVIITKRMRMIFIKLDLYP